MNTGKGMHRGNFGLTPAETAVLGLLQKGFSRNQIAEALCVSLNTVKTHLKNVYQKLKVRNGFAALAKLREEDIFPSQKNYK